jgi:uncharacterized protein (DUF1800 family)
MADEKALIAHLLRRTGFGPQPGHVEELAAGGYAAALDKVLAATPLAVDPPTLGTKDDEAFLVRWWLEILGRPDAGLHEKMVWFWHGHLTSSVDKAEPIAIARQHQLLRAQALGNARQLLQDITIDAAMLGWLDGKTSTAAAPNENYGRELMELFALGREFQGAPTYSPADVRAAAYALSGWEVDDDKAAKVSFNAERGPTKSVDFLGKSVANAREVVDVVCDHPAFASFIAGKLYQYFHGISPEPSLLASLANTFRSGNLEIKPLVTAILRDPTFVEHRMNRPRFPIEWVLGTLAVLGPAKNDEPTEILSTLGQVPFQPPNVAGWPLSPRWLSAGASMSRASYVLDRSSDTEVTADPDPVAWVLRRASLFEVSDTTKNALAKAAGKIDSKRGRASALHALALSSPEFALA